MPEFEEQQSLPRWVLALLLGGWGIRYGNLYGISTGCLTIQGDRGVVLKKKQRKWHCDQVLVGSDKPEVLCSALGRPAAEIDAAI